MRPIDAYTLGALTRLNQTRQGRLHATLTDRKNPMPPPQFKDPGTVLGLDAFLVADAVGTVVAQLERDYARFVTDNLTLELDDPTGVVQAWLVARGRVDLSIEIDYAGRSFRVFFGTVAPDDIELREDTGRWILTAKGWKDTMRSMFPSLGFSGVRTLRDILAKTAAYLGADLIDRVPLILTWNNESVFSAWESNQVICDVLGAWIFDGYRVDQPEWLAIAILRIDGGTMPVWGWVQYAIEKTTGIIRIVEWIRSYGVTVPGEFRVKASRARRSGVDYYLFYVEHMRRFFANEEPMPVLIAMLAWDCTNHAMLPSGFPFVPPEYDDGIRVWTPIAPSCDCDPVGNTYCAFRPTRKSNGAQLPGTREYLDDIVLGRVRWQDFVNKIGWTLIQTFSLLYGPSPQGWTGTYWAGGAYTEGWQPTLPFGYYCLWTWDSLSSIDRRPVIFVWNRDAGTWLEARGYASIPGIRTGPRWVRAVAIGVCVITERFNRDYHRVDLGDAVVNPGESHAADFRFYPQPWFGAWNVLTAYVVDDVIWHGNYVYVCTADNTGQPPPDGAYWQLLVGDTLGYLFYPDESSGRRDVNRIAASLYEPPGSIGAWLQELNWNGNLGRLNLTRMAQAGAMVPMNYRQFTWDKLSGFATRPRSKEPPIPSIVNCGGYLGFRRQDPNVPPAEARNICLVYPGFPPLVNCDVAEASLAEFLDNCQEATGTFIRFPDPLTIRTHTRQLGPAGSAPALPSSLVVEGYTLMRRARTVVALTGAAGSTGRWPTMPNPRIDTDTFNLSSEYIPAAVVQHLARWLYDVLYAQFEWDLEGELDLPVYLEVGDEYRVALREIRLHLMVTALDWQALSGADNWGRVKLKAVGYAVR